jgi:cytochrome c oxidase subunit 2
MWKLQHPEGQREINELHIPINRPVRLILNSEDVIHSFSVPAFRIKQDVVPGRTMSAWFEATQTGKYHLFCAQYCGVDHAQMAGWIYAMDPAAYQHWLQQTGAEHAPMASEGAKLFQQFGCSGCHVASTAVRAPTLSGLYGNPVPLSDGHIVTADDAYIRDSILLPDAQVVAGYKAIMPSYKGVLSEDQVMELTAYVKSLTQADAQPNAGRSLNGTNRSAGVQEMQQNARRRMEEKQQPVRGGGNR